MAKEALDQALKPVSEIPYLQKREKEKRGKVFIHQTFGEYLLCAILCDGS